MKIFIRYLFAFLLFIILFNKISLLMVRKGNGYGTDVLNFYKQPKNSIDILYLGSSHTYTAFNPYLIEEKTKLRGYDFATQQQPIWITYYYLKEALKYQKIKYVVLDVHMAVMDFEFAEEEVNRDAIDKMRLSKNKIDIINASVENNNEKVSYYLNIIKYHTRYKSLVLEDFKTAFLNYTIDNKGYIGLKNKNYAFKNNPYSNSKANLNSKVLEYLNKIITLAKENNIELILVKTPCQYTIKQIEKLNTIEDIAEKNNLLFLNYIKNIDSLDLNYNEDFYDGGHLAHSGSHKFSLKFIESLREVQND